MTLSAEAVEIIKGERNAPMSALAEDFALGGFRASRLSRLEAHMNR